MLIKVHMHHPVQVPFWMFHLLLEDIAIQCHALDKPDASKDARHSVWQRAQTQHYARMIFGAGGSMSLLPKAAHVCEGVCLNVNGHGGMNASIIVQLCCSVSVHVTTWGPSSAADVAKPARAKRGFGSKKFSNFTYWAR